MAVIAEIGRVIGSSLDIDEVYESFAAETRKLIAFDSLTVNAYDPRKNNLSVAYVAGMEIDGRRKGDPLDLRGSLSEAVLRTRRSHCIQPESTDEALSRYPRLAAIFQAGLRSIMCIPLVYRNETIGVLHFRSRRPNAYSEQDLRLAEKIVAQIVGAIANARLYSEIRETEKALRESEERYRTLVENANDIVFRTDHRGRFTFINPAGFRTTGYSAEDVIGKSFLEVIRPDLREDAMKLFGRQWSEGIQNTYSEYPILTKTGQELWLGQNTQLIVENGRATGFQAVARDVTDRRNAEAELKKREAQLIEMGNHDSLTGLPNRKLFSDRLDMALTQARRNRKKVGIAMLDLDRFKEVNDTLGHDTGDLLLKATAERLSVVLRKGDTVARIGGDEFVLILPELESEEDAVQVAQKIVDRFRNPFLIDGRQLVVTTSIGIALYPTDGKDEGALLKRADIAMYRAKEAGRAGYQLYRKDQG